MKHSPSIFSLLLAALLALLVGSPLCCCAATPPKPEQASCCCGGGEGKKETTPKKEACLCASQAPRDLPKAMLPPGPGPEQALVPPLQTAFVPAPVVLELDYLPRWQPGRPWHAPPSQRRALLVSRTL